MKEEDKKPIDNVTVPLLDIGLRLIGIRLDSKTIDRLIDIVELIEDKGGDTSLSDFAELEHRWDYINTISPNDPTQKLKESSKP